MDDVLTPADVGKRLTKSAAWVATEARAGRLPGRKVGRSWRFTEADLVAYLERVSTSATPSGKATARRRRAA